MPTPPTDVTVRLDDRVRLFATVLALTRYPDHAQQVKPHLTHGHARDTRKHLAAHAAHPVVGGMQAMLDQRVSMEAIFTMALAMRWPQLTLDAFPRWMPGGWDAALRDFYTTSGVQGWWATNAHAWDKSLHDAQSVMTGFTIKPLFSSFLGPVTETLVLLPHITYPAHHEVALRLAGTLYLLVPPRLAWGDSPPWPYNEDPAHLFRAAINGYGRLLLMAYLRDKTEAISEASQTALPVSEGFARRYPTWVDQFTALFIAGTTALYLEEHVSKAEFDSYVLMERKTRDMDILPSVIHVLRRFLTETAGDKFKTLIDYLPVFARQVRVAQRMVRL